MTRWYRDEWWSSANIVATDFYLGNNIIEESIRSNRRRSKDCQNNKDNHNYNLNNQHISTSTALTTESIDEADRNGEGHSVDTNPNQSSSWWSWFGF